MQNDSDMVVDHFRECTSDRTPTLTRHSANVVYAPVSSDTEVTKRCLSVLSEAEVLRAERFVTEELRGNFIQRRAFRRYCGALAIGSPDPLSQIVFDEQDKGRPYLPDRLDISFSFSACRSGFLGSWSATNSIGVDIEDKTQDIEAVDLAHQFFSAAEAMAIEEARGPARQRTFLQLWCLKEAALKCIGEGLPMGLDSFEFDLGPSLRVVRTPRYLDASWQFSPFMIEAIDCFAALVIRIPAR